MGQYFYLESSQFCNLPGLLRYLTPPKLLFYHIYMIIFLFWKSESLGTML